MIRIGHSRWFASGHRKPIPGGRLEIQLSLSPQARRFKVFAKEWRGLEYDLVDKVVEVRTVTKSAQIDNYEFCGPVGLQVVSALAREVAEDAVGECIYRNVVSGDDYDKAAGIYLVRVAVMRAAQSALAEPPEQAEEIDLSGDMRAAYEERERQRQRAWQEHLARQAERTVASSEAAKKSIELLYSYLTPAELAEAKSKHHVTVKTLAGEFVVPVVGHGLIRQYQDGRYVQSLCVVFRDHSIPLGDEALMKIAFLKTDPQKLFKISNKFVEKGLRGRCVA